MPDGHQGDTQVLQHQDGVATLQLCNDCIEAGVNFIGYSAVVSRCGHQLELQRTLPFGDVDAWLQLFGSNRDPGIIQDRCQSGRSALISDLRMKWYILQFDTRLATVELCHHATDIAGTA